ncbi:flagellar biosynthetic protein FliO [Granulicella arctica]|uniref:flagellar biosynthetic protein FliO n=1 Tax=Granulicella arctica TaxID=940613 RepID=UPI0021DF92A8|nr:flagellar biosynthetic protein FliO [Granulicella arctica]
MELVQGFTRRQEIEKIPSAGGLGAWMVGALQGRVRIKWRGGVPDRMQQMQLLETLPLGGKRQMMLIACEGERYLVGCGPEAVTSIVKLMPTVSEARPAVKTWL